MSPRHWSFLAAALVAGGCASSLGTFAADGTRTSGIPISAPVLVRITETTRFEVDPANPAFKDYCTNEITSRYEVLAIGERHYISFDPAMLGKGEFKIELTESGALKSVSVNSDATAGADKVGDLLSTVLPYAAVPRTATELRTPSASEDTAEKVKARYCLKVATEVTRIERVQVAPAK